MNLEDFVSQENARFK